MVTNQKLWAVLMLCGASFLALAPSPADAQKKPKEEAPEVDIAAELAKSGQLIEFGRKYKVPAALVDAGGILLKVQRANLKEIKDEPTLELPPGAVKEEVKVKSLADQVEDLFDEARGLATDQKAVSDQIKAVKASIEGTRGVRGGPKRHQAALPKLAMHTHKWRFAGGAPAYVAYQSTVPVMVQIVSTTGEVVAFGQGLSGQAMWFPGPKDGDFVVRVKSMTTVTTTYMLVSN